MPTEAVLDRRVRACDRLTQQASLHKVRIKDLVRQLLPMTPLTGDLGLADLAVLERWADPHDLVKAGNARITKIIASGSHGHQGAPRAAEWLASAHASLELYGDHPAVAFAELAAEVATEVRLLRAIQSELAAHEGPRETAYHQVDPTELARSLPGIKTIGGPALVATMGQATRFPSAAHFRSFTGLAPKASETGNTDRKGEPMSKAGNSLLRTTLVRAADQARKVDPQLARIYYVQMAERGKNHIAANCVVAAHLAERAWLVMRRGVPYVLRDIDGTEVTPEEAKAIIAERYTVTEATRQRRRSNKGGKAPQQVLDGTSEVNTPRAWTERGDLPRPPIQPDRRPASNDLLDGASPIGNQSSRSPHPYASVTHRNSENERHDHPACQEEPGHSSARRHTTIHPSKGDAVVKAEHCNHVVTTVSKF